MNPRQERARQMMQEPGYAAQTARGEFRVRSQSHPDKSYTVRETPGGLVCDCPDHEFRGADCKHIKVILEVVRRNRGYKNGAFRIMERSKLNLCKFCDSGRVVKAGKSRGRPQFRCNDCKRRFTANVGFERKQFDEGIITGALQMYYSGMSVRDIANHYEMMGTRVSHMTIYNWVSEYSRLTTVYVNGIVPRVGNWFRADEVWVRIAGHQCYLFASMDDDTRYWLASDLATTKFQHNADSLLDMTKRQAGKIPRHFITDGLQAYQKSSKRVFGKQTNHMRHIHLKGDRNNNKMERLNGEIRDREKVFRGLKRMDTAVLDGMRIYYNYAKKHGYLKGMTPAEASLIRVDGPNKWKTIIQNASLSMDSE